MMPLSQSEDTTSQTTEMEPKKRPLMPADLIKAVMEGNRNVLEQRLGLAEEDPDHVKIHIDQASDPAPQQAIAIKEILASELQSATRFGNTILHLLVANKQHNDLAVKVFEKDRKLLTAQNKKLETPLHIAAKFGNMEVIESLNRCAPDLVKNVLRRTNDFSQEKRKTNDNEDTTFNEDTALHIAVKNVQKEVVLQLMRIDREMAYEFNKEGLSPLHIAIANTKDVSDYDYMVRYIPSLSVYDKIDNVLDLVQIMLDVDPAAAWTQFADGTFPIHFAARMGKAEIVAQFISNNWEQALLLLDPDGRNLFHIAAANDKWNVIWRASEELRNSGNDERLKQVINAKDCKGNTPWHIAAGYDGSRVVYLLKDLDGIDMTRRNNSGRTPFQILASHRLEKSTWRERYEINGYIRQHGQKISRQWSLLHKVSTPEEMSEKTQVIGLGSVLITTVAFAAAFTFPGGYNSESGTPVLGRKYMFRAFMIANALAFVEAFASVFLLIVNTVQNKMDENSLRVLAILFTVLPEDYIESAALLFLSSATTMVKAFGIGSYVMLAPVNLPIAIIILVLGMLFGSSTVISYCGPLASRLSVVLSGIYRYDGSLFILLVENPKYCAMWAVRHGWPLLIIFGVAFLK